MSLKHCFNKGYKTKDVAGEDPDRRAKMMTTTTTTTMTTTRRTANIFAEKAIMGSYSSEDEVWDLGSGWTLITTDSEVTKNSINAIQ